MKEKNTFIKIEKYHVMFPCQFCGQETPAIVTYLKGNEERNYKDVAFVTCPTCMDKIRQAFADHLSCCGECVWNEPHKCRMGQPFDPDDPHNNDRPMCEFGKSCR